MVDQIGWETVNTETHCFGHFSKALSFDLMLVGISREIGSLSVNIGFHQGESSTL